MLEFIVMASVMATVGIGMTIQDFIEKRIEAKRNVNK
jgi:hypothetical protein